jgi:hypothetical protein
MIKLDNDLLTELGLASLPEEEKKKLLAHIYETLEMRVGMKLAEQMNDSQLTEFEQFIDRNDEQGALKWLEANFPNYKDVVASEFEVLKREVGQSAPQILSSSSDSANSSGSSAQAQSSDYDQHSAAPGQPGQEPYGQPPYPAQTPPQHPQGGQQQY